MKYRCLNSDTWQVQTRPGRALRRFRVRAPPRAMTGTSRSRISSRIKRTAFVPTRKINFVDFQHVAPSPFPYLVMPSVWWDTARSNHQPIGGLKPCCCLLLQDLFLDFGVRSFLVTWGSERPWKQISQMLEGQGGASQRSPSLPLYMSVQEPWKGLGTLHATGVWGFGYGSSNYFARNVLGD